MPRLELTRTEEDHKVYALPGVGELRVDGWMSGKVEATAGGHAYTFDKHSLFESVSTATDATGSRAGEFHPRRIMGEGGGGTIVWRGAEWELRPATEVDGAYALGHPGDTTEFALIDEAIWSKRPVPVSVAEGADVDPGLLLFAIFAVRLVTEDIEKLELGGNSAMGGPAVG
jgi:hypothetical protein